MGETITGRVPAEPGCRPSDQAASRFWAKVNRGAPNECWDWTATLSDGYGRFWKAGRLQQAHRVSFQLAGNIVPDNLVVDHVCRNRSCVNPAHLRVVTARQNLFENSVAAAAINSSKTHCIRGHDLQGNNLWAKPNGNRRCRLCDNAWNRNYRAKMKAKRDAER